MSEWRMERNIECSLKDFLDEQIIVDSLTGENNAAVSVRIGRRDKNDWTLPCISVYVESGTLERFEIGSNKRDIRYLIIIDIYGSGEGERLDLSNWVYSAINNGWRNYTYTYNASNPESPTKVAGGMVNVDFLSNTRIALGQNVDIWDAHRHRISINTWVTGG